MKKFALLSVFLLATAAFAIQQLDQNISVRLESWLTGIIVGPRSIQTTDTQINTHKITRMLGGSLAFDFASVTITCEDSTAITTLGARTGDPCFVGPPTTISGAGTGLHSNFTCYVSAADAVKIRHCAAGTADNPASATYAFRVISSQ